MPNQTKTIAFRLHDAIAARLSADAEARQMSAGEYARFIVIEHLGNGGPAETLQAIAETKTTLTDLQVQLRKVAFTLLCNAGNAEPKEALDWVKGNLGPLPPQ